MRRTCAHPGCTVPAGRVRCQDCGKSFCEAHVGAAEFSAPRRPGAPTTDWTRYVCAACARRTLRSSTEAIARAAHDQARRDERGYWWERPI
ncbi:MAG: hypothetical protein QOF33_4238 [Thermomicrobiales bacterium]|jgi:DNA-directed RNA polymerase subunit RPC12/RpoP|nr:hypothetical protein [Thermomicrobiales bacterium]